MEAGASGAAAGPPPRRAGVRDLRDGAGRAARRPVPGGRHQPERPQPEPLQPVQHPRRGGAGRRVDGAVRRSVRVHGDDAPAGPERTHEVVDAFLEVGDLRAGPPRRVHRQVRRRRGDGVLQRADPLRGSRCAGGRGGAGDRGRDAGPQRAVRHRLRAAIGVASGWAHVGGSAPATARTTPPSATW